MNTREQYELSEHRSLVTRRNLNRAALAAMQGFGFDHPITRKIREKLHSLDSLRVPATSALKGGRL